MSESGSGSMSRSRLESELVVRVIVYFKSVKNKFTSLK